MMCMNERVRRQNDLNGEKTIIMEEKKETLCVLKTFSILKGGLPWISPYRFR